MNEQLEELYLDCLPTYGAGFAKNMRFSSKENIMRAIEKYPLYLQYVEEQDTDMAIAAVSRYGNALEYVKDQTEEICMLAIENDKPFNVTSHFQDPLYAQEFAFSTIDRSYCNPLRYVKKQTYEMALKSVTRNPISIVDVHDITLDLAAIAMKDKGAIDLIPQEFLEQLITEDVIAKDPPMISFLENPTENMIRLAIKEFPDAAAFAPRHMLDELYEMNPRIVSYLEDPPETFILEEPHLDQPIGMEELKQNVHLIERVSNPTIEMVDYALSVDIRTVCGISTLTETQKWTVIRKDPYYARYIDDLSLEMID